MNTTKPTISATNEREVFSIL